MYFGYYQDILQNMCYVITEDEYHDFTEGKVITEVIYFLFVYKRYFTALYVQCLLTYGFPDTVTFPSCGSIFLSLVVVFFAHLTVIY